MIKVGEIVKVQFVSPPHTDQENPSLLIGLAQKRPPVFGRDRSQAWNSRLHDRKHIHPTDWHTLAAEVAFPGGLVVRMGEDDIFGADLDALEAVEAQAVLLGDVVGTALILKNAINRADLGTVTALGAGPHLEHAGLREVGFDGQSSLLRVVLAVGTVLTLGGLAPDGQARVKQGTGQEASPASRTLRAVCMKVHGYLL
jgi:hypothetical protein